MDKGAFRLNPDGTYAVDYTKIKSVVRDLAHELLTIEATGDYAAGKRMIETLGQLRPGMAQTIAQPQRYPHRYQPDRCDSRCDCTRARGTSDTWHTERASNCGDCFLMQRSLQIFLVALSLARHSASRTPIVLRPSAPSRMGAATRSPISEPLPLTSRESGRRSSRTAACPQRRRQLQLHPRSRRAETVRRAAQPTAAANSTAGRPLRVRSSTAVP